MVGHCVEFEHRVVFSNNSTFAGCHYLSKSNRLVRSSSILIHFLLKAAHQTAKNYSKLGCHHSRPISFGRGFPFLQWIIQSDSTSFRVWDTWEQENGLLIQFSQVKNQISPPSGSLFFFGDFSKPKGINLMRGERRKCVAVIALSKCSLTFR